MKMSVYVDGFNLYFAIRRLGPYKWLNLRALAVAWLPPDADIQKIKVFTARVSGSTDPQSPRRQQIYLNALRTLPGIEVIWGSFMQKNSWRPLLNLPLAQRNCPGWPGNIAPGRYMVPPQNAGAPDEAVDVGSYGTNAHGLAPHANAVKVQFHHFEEKGSDVNLAAHLVNDAWRGDFEAAAVVSNDTDLVEPIRIVTQEKSLPVFLLSPKQERAAPQLAAVASHVRYLNKNMLKAAQFPDDIPRADKTPITKPDTW